MLAALRPLRRTVRCLQSRWLSHLVPEAAKNVHQILKCVQYQAPSRMLVLHDPRCELSTILTQAYQQVAPSAQSINFDQVNKDDIIQMFDEMTPGDLVVMVQSGAFSLDGYRIRLKLFEKGIKNVEHVHLENMPANQHPAYIAALGFDPFGEDAGLLGRRLKEKIDQSKHFEVICHDGSKLIYETEMEPTKLNLGDYEGMQNVGGTFPVGEVFSEPKALEKVNGTFSVWGFPNINRLVEVVEPFPLTVENGRITDYSRAPASFKEIADGVLGGEGDLVIREFGLGLNRAISKFNPLNDVTAFERQLGLHISMGKKHTVFAKEGISKRKTRFHIDMFVDVSSIKMDEHQIWKDNDFVRGSPHF